MPTPKRPVLQRATTTLIALVAVLLAAACTPVLQARLRNGPTSSAQPTATERQIITAVN